MQLCKMMQLSELSYNFVSAMHYAMLLVGHIQIFQKSLTLGVCMCMLTVGCEYDSSTESIFSPPGSTVLFAEKFCTVEQAKPVMSKIMLNLQASTF